MDVEKNELHVKLQELRDANKIKNREIANTLNVSEPTVSNWMTGTSMPNRENLKALADFFKVPVASLNGINEENKEEIDKLLDKIDTLQTEIANKDHTIEGLREAQNYQRKALLILIGAVLIIGAAVFRSDLPENPTTSQGLLFLVTLGVGLFFFIAGFYQVIRDRIKEDIHSAKKDADSGR